MTVTGVDGRPQHNDDRLNVFVSYAREDVAFAERIVAALEARGCRALIDKRDLADLEKFKAELADFIGQADVIVFIGSSHSVASKWVLWEIEQGLKLNKRIAPVSGPGCSPASSISFRASDGLYGYTARPWACAQFSGGNTLSAGRAIPRHRY